MPEGVFSHRSRGQFGPGCSIARMANRLVIHFFSSSFDPSSPSKGQGGALQNSTGGPQPNCPAPVGLASAESVTIQETLNRAPSTRASYALR